MKLELIIIIIASILILLLIFWNRKLSSQINSNTNKLNNKNVECKQSNKALTESEEKYRYLIDNCMVGIFNSDLNGEFIFANLTMSRMFDFDNPSHMIGKVSLKLWKNIKQREQFLIELKKYSHISNFEAEGVTHSGQKIQILLSAILHANVINGIALDVTDQKRVEQKKKSISKDSRHLPLS